MSLGYSAEIAVEVDANFQIIPSYKKEHEFIRSFASPGTQHMYESMGTENIYNETVVQKFMSWDNQNNKIAKIKLVYDVVEEVSENAKEQLFNGTLTKMKRMLLINEAIKSQNSSNNLQYPYEDVSFLEPTYVTKCKLKESEKIEIRSFVEAQLRQKISNYISRYNELDGITKDVLRNRDGVPSKILHLNNELGLLISKSKIDEIYISYEKHLDMILKLLTDWSECKEKLSKARSNYTENILLQAQLTEIQTIISKLSCQIRLFLESPTSIDAFRILKSKLNFTVQKLDSDIQRKSKLKNEYESLKCAEYDEILKKYIDMCDAVEKKKHFFDGL